MKHAAWATIPERGSVLGLRIALFILKTLGHGITTLVMVPVVAYFFISGKTSRRASGKYLRRLHETYPESVAKPNLWREFKHHLQFGIVIVDRLWLWLNKINKFTFTSRGRENLFRADGKGILLIGAHIGSFDALRSLALDRNLKVNVLLHRENSRKINAMLAMLDPATNVRVTELIPGDVNAIFELKNKLDQGELVSILGDRHPPNTKSRETWIPFLGKQAPFPQNVWILASLLECPVCLVTGVRGGFRSYKVFAEPFAERIILPRKTREKALEAYIQRYAQRLEDICSQYPYQWFNFYDFWSLDHDEDRWM